MWQLNIALGSYSVPGEWYWLWALLIGPHLVLAHTRAGRVLGLDSFLQSPTVRVEWRRTVLGQLLPRLS